MEIKPRERRIEALLGQRFEWTARQREVLDLIARGRTNQEVADTLGISLDGAKWHMREILSKLAVDTREEAAEYWRRRNGWLQRGRRVVRGLTVSVAAKWSLAGAAVLAVTATGAFVAITTFSGGNADDSTANVRPSDSAEELTFRGSGGFTGDFTVSAALAEADVAVRGRVMAVRNGNHDPRPAAAARIYRVAEVRVMETLGGDHPGEVIDVFLPGGTDGTVTVHVSDWGPELRAGEDVILFLNRPNRYEVFPPALWTANVDLKVDGGWATDSLGKQLPVDELMRQIIAAGRP